MFLLENTYFFDYLNVGVLDKVANKHGFVIFQRKSLGWVSKKGAQMREIAFGRVFPNKVSWTLGRFKARAGHFQIKSLGKHQLWTQRKPPGVKKNRSPSEMAVPGIVYIYIYISEGVLTKATRHAGVGVQVVAHRGGFRKARLQRDWRWCQAVAVRRT